MKETLHIFLTLAYIGHVPYFPGTCASLVCSLIFLWFPFRTLATDIFIVLILVGISVISISSYKPSEKDPRYIVIDEFVGMYVTMLGHRGGFAHTVLGFILFRFFDIMKPYPVRKVESLPGAWGIICDDIAAGIFSNLSLWLLKSLTGTRYGP
jgi:phosphatidylglycerophosphatase A